MVALTGLCRSCDSVMCCQMPNPPSVQPFAGYLCGSEVVENAIFCGECLAALEKRASWTMSEISRVLSKREITIYDATGGRIPDKSFLRRYGVKR